MLWFFCIPAKWLWYFGIHWHSHSMRTQTHARSSSSCNGVLIIEQQQTHVWNNNTNKTISTWVIHTLKMTDNLWL
jgi:hypothetical protein